MKKYKYKWEKDFYTSPYFRLSNAIILGAYIQHFYAYYDEGREIIFGDELTIDHIVWMGTQPTLHEIAKFIEANKQNNIQIANTDIGFRKEYARYSIAGGFNIALPMSFNIYRDDKTLVEFKNIHTYIAMQVYSFANEEIDAIMEYVIKQMDITNEEKGELTDIKIKGIKSAVYKKSIDNDDYVFTVVAVSKSLALLAWFTYNGKENEELCIEAIKSISIDN